MATSGEMMMKKDAMKDKMIDDGKMMKDKMIDDGKMMKKDETMMKSTMSLSDAGHGSRGEHVIALQNFLSEKGFLVLPSGIATGYFGPATKKAVMMYQKSVGVTPTGFFGPKTRMSMHDKMGMKADDSMMMKKDGAMMKDKMMNDGKMMKKDTMAQ